MDANSFASVLQTRTFARPILFFDELDSTNVEAGRRIASASLTHGTVLIAARQSAGRGTGKNTWISDTPEGLWFSLILDEPPQFQPIQLLPAIALVNFLRAEHQIEAHSKWPNDVLIGSKKLAGTLIETRTAIDGSKKYIVGIGVNVNQLSFDTSIASKAISLRIVAGHSFQLETVFAGFLKHLETWYESNANPVSSWLKTTRMVGRLLHISDSGQETMALCEGMAETGALILRKLDGTVEHIVSHTRMDIGLSYAEEDIAAWGVVARCRSAGKHPLLDSAPEPRYASASDAHDLDRKKSSIPFLEGLFTARDIAFRTSIVDLLSANETITQLVSIGSGYDDWYPKNLPTRIRVFEIDDDVRVAKKRIIAGANYGAVLIAADARHEQSLHASLTRAGYRPDTATIFVMQGLLYYLSQANTLALLQSLRRISASPMYIAFDIHVGPTPSDPVLEGMNESGMRTDFLSESEWLLVLERTGFDLVSKTNLGEADPIGELAPWRDRVQSTVFLASSKFTTSIAVGVADCA